MTLKKSELESTLISDWAVEEKAAKAKLEMEAFDDLPSQVRSYLREDGAINPIIVMKLYLKLGCDTDRLLEELRKLNES